MMQGRIGVDSKPGKGSTFWFELKLDKAGHQSRMPGKDVFDDLTVQLLRPTRLYLDYYTSLFTAWGIHHQAIEDLESALQDTGEDDSARRVLLLEADTVIGNDSVLKQIQAWRDKHKNTTVIITCPQSMLAMIPESINAAADLILSKPVIQSEFFNALLAIVGDAVESYDTALAESPTLHNFDAQVLVVEDNPTNVTIVTGLLNKFGVEVSHAENGLKALSLMEHNSYDLVLMDCQMPELDGYEATRRIRNNGTVLDADIPVIALTAHAMREDEQKCLDAGMNDYLSKPIDPYQLNKALANWLPEHCLEKVASVSK
jgi:CheY-like chemotaxis protein